MTSFSENLVKPLWDNSIPTNNSSIFLYFLFCRFSGFQVQTETFKNLRGNSFNDLIFKNLMKPLWDHSCNQQFNKKNFLLSFMQILVHNCTALGTYWTQTYVSHSKLWNTDFWKLFFVSFCRFSFSGVFAWLSGLFEPKHMYRVLNCEILIFEN